MNSKRLSRAKASKDQERRRVESLIKRDRDDSYADDIRKMAQMQAESGDFTNLADTVVSPTPEQLASGEFTTFIPKQPKDTVRVIRSVRRLTNTTVMRMNQKGQISDDGLKFCLWYSKTYSEAGFDGNIPSVDMGREVFGGPNDRVPFTERQCDAQHKLRKARAAISVGFLKFFEAIVIKKLPVYRAARFARLRKSRAQARFSAFCDKGYEIINEMGELD